jgi:cation:H+ antiporter
MPPFIIGVTIIAFGTSLPEVATSIASVLSDSSEIVIGNVVGSNLANILLILGITAIVGKHLVVNKDIIKIDLPILLGSTILLFLITLDGKITYIDGSLSLLILITYLVYNVRAGRKLDKKELREISKKKKEEREKKEKEHLNIKYPLILLVSGTFLAFAANWTIVSVIELSKIFDIGKDVIAVSAIAIGTSLPELVVSVIAAKKGKADLAIGNITGSNIFNNLGVIGIPALFGTLTIPLNIITFSIPLLLFVTILYIFSTMDKEITKWEGITLLLLYIAFMGKTFGII